MIHIPRWKDNPNFNAQAAHFAVGYGVAVTARWRFSRQLRWIAWAFVGYAALKEFWYDANYEIPKQIFRDNLEDFAFYILGLLVGLFAW